MSTIGRKIYYDKATGNVLVNSGERTGFVRVTTVEEDMAAYKVLAERVPETVGLLEFEYGAYAQDFEACNGYRVNIETGKLEFSYPDPEQPEPVIEYRKPLSEEIGDIKQAIAELSMLFMGVMGNAV